MRLGQQATGGWAGDPGQPSVEQNDIGMAGLYQFEDAIGVRRFTHDLKVWLPCQHDLEPLADHLVVVDDGDADHSDRGIGRLNLTVAPASSPLTTSNVPPSPRTWSRLWRSPKCR